MIHPELSRQQLIELFHATCPKDEWERLTAEPPAAKTTASVRRVLGYIFQARWVRCGHTTCRTCPHGPYLYARRRLNGKQIQVPLGRPYASTR
jgi:hypothetical protein